MSIIENNHNTVELLRVVRIENVNKSCDHTIYQYPKFTRNTQSLINIFFCFNQSWNSTKISVKHQKSFSTWVWKNWEKTRTTNNNSNSSIASPEYESIFAIHIRSRISHFIIYFIPFILFTWPMFLLSIYTNAVYSDVHLPSKNSFFYFFQMNENAGVHTRSPFAWKWYIVYIFTIHNTIMHTHKSKCIRICIFFFHLLQLRLFFHIHSQWQRHVMRLCMCEWKRNKQ